MTIATPEEQAQFEKLMGFDKPIHKTRVRANGTVEGHHVETYYLPAERIFLEADYVCIVGDDGGVDFETRVPRDVLERLLRGESEPDRGKDARVVNSSEEPKT